MATRPDERRCAPTAYMSSRRISARCGVRLAENCFIQYTADGTAGSGHAHLTLRRRSQHRQLWGKLRRRTDTLASEKIVVPWLHSRVVFPTLHTRDVQQHSTQADAVSVGNTARQSFCGSAAGAGEDRSVYLACARLRTCEGTIRTQQTAACKKLMHRIH